MNRCSKATAALVLALCACEALPEHSPPSKPRSFAPVAPFAPPSGFAKLRVGLTPYLGKDAIRQGHVPLATWLEEALHTPVELLVADSYGDAVDRLVRGEYDLIEISPYSLAMAERRTKLRCLVQGIANGSASAAGYIVVRDDSPIHSVEDLKGVQFGFVDPASTSGYLYAAKLLRDRGLNPKTDFSTVDFLGNHEAVLLAVLDGRIDAGATFQGAFSALRRSKNVDPLSFRIIGKTPRMPRDAFCASASLAPEVADAVTRALLSLNTKHREGRDVLDPLEMNGFQTFDDSMYDDVRRIATEVGPP